MSLVLVWALLAAPPVTAQDSTGNWVVDQARAQVQAAAGTERTNEWLRKGLESLQSTAFRRYYVEQGYFLIPVDGLSEKHAGLYLPFDPGDDPRVLLMKDATRLDKDALGLSEAVRKALLRGEPELAKLAGRELFDARVARKDGGFDVVAQAGADKAWYCKIRQKATQVRAEAGAGDSVPLAEGWRAGAETGVKADAGYARRTGAFGDKAQPLAKAGVWGPAPLPGTGVGLAAQESWLPRDWATELRGGVFHADDALGVVTVQGYHRWSGSRPPGRDNANGGEAALSSAPGLAYYVETERSEPRRGRGSASVTAGVAVALRPADAARRLADLDAAAGRYGAETFLGDKRARLARAAAPVTLDGAALTIEVLLDRARGLERGVFDASGGQADVPGWALCETRSRKPGEPEADRRLERAAAAVRLAIDEQIRKELAPESADRPLPPNLKRVSVWLDQDDAVERRRLELASNPRN